MIFKGLLLKNFRNYQDLALAFNKNLNIFIGQNGQGKTNILEAIYVLSRTQSFRPGKTDVLINKQVFPQQSVLKTKILSEKNLENSVKIVIEGNKKTLFLNEKKSRSTFVTKLSPIILFSPESLSAIKEGPEVRRQLVDELLIHHQPHNEQIFADFRKLLKTRNKLLRDYKSEKMSSREFYDVLEVLNQKYVPLAVNVTKLRIDALKAILPDLSNTLKLIMNQENVDISVDYLISDQPALTWGEKEITESIIKRLQELEKAEISGGISLVGPQKHDISFIFNRDDSRYYCSQGQQRALILAFKMAQVELYKRLHDEYPVLLLDDVMSELDEEKRDCLVKFLNSIQSQIFITTTDVRLPEDFNNKDLSLFTVQEGSINSET